MYSDPALIRKHVVKLSFNDLEADVLKSLANYDGGALSALCRRLVLEGARSVFHEADSAGVAQQNQGTQ